MAPSGHAFGHRIEPHDRAATHHLVIAAAEGEPRAADGDRGSGRPGAAVVAVDALVRLEVQVRDLGGEERVRRGGYPDAAGTGEVMVRQIRSPCGAVTALRGGSVHRVLRSG